MKMLPPSNDGDYVFLNNTEMVQVLTSSIEAFLNGLHYYWKKLGIDRKEKSIRASSIYHNFQSLINETLQKERKLVLDLEKHTELLSKERQDLCEILCIKDEKFYCAHKETDLLKEEEKLSRHIDELKIEKNSRNILLQNLCESEYQLCSVLGNPPLAPPSSGVLDKEHLCNLENHVKDLKCEKENRLLEFKSLKEELIEFEETTGVCPRYIFHANVNLNEDNDLAISQKNINELKDLVKKAHELKNEMEQNIICLKEKLEDLWTDLQFEEEHRKLFLAINSDCKLSVLDAFADEIENCKSLQRKKLEQCINSARNELIILWNKCCFSESERKEFSIFYDDNWSEQLLKAHVSEIQKMKLFYEERKEIFGKIKKWHELWDAMIVLEKMSTDPKRLSNRGGTLLQEERERKRLVTQFPKLETGIMNWITDYEKRSGNSFTVYGENFLQFIENRWTRHQNEKENQKMERKQNTPGSVGRKKLTGICVVTPRFLTKSGRTPIKKPTSLQKMGESWATPGIKKRIWAEKHSMSVPKTNMSVFVQRVTPCRRILIESNSQWSN